MQKEKKQKKRDIFISLKIIVKSIVNQEFLAAFHDIHELKFILHTAVLFRIIFNGNENIAYPRKLP